jgi:serine/threonine-protein kinase
MGKYQVSECIGRGGMAEVFLARQEGIGGFEKLVALKRIYPHLLHDESFIEMFLAEARIAASLQHPKIVQILDIESDDDGFFIVMEYLAGESLGYIFETLSEEGDRVPPEMVCRIGSDVATGLQIAHDASDAEGQPRPVVHRDVTPSNILVTFAGDVKVLDFGVAKAIKRKATTDKGVMKGKTSYLSPEIIAGDPIDARADIFQLGIVVHEMLTGKQLFRGDTVPDVIQAITESEIPLPSSVVPGLPDELDQVVLKALSRNPSERYQTAEDFAQALDTVGSSLGESVSARMLSKWMHSTFPDRVQQKRRLRKIALDHQASVADKPRSFPVESDGLPTRDQMTVNERRPKKTEPVGASMLPRLVGGGAVVLALAVGLFFWLSDSGPRSVSPGVTPEPALVVEPERSLVAEPETVDAMPVEASPRTYRVSTTAVPATTAIELDGKQVATGEYSAILDGEAHELRFVAEGYLPQRFTVSPEHPAPNVVRLQPEKTIPTPTGTVKGAEKQPEKRDKPPVRKTKPFGSDNLNPWEAQ